MNGSRPDDQLIDLGNLLTDATQSEIQVWMVQKDKLDHGPFSARELGQQIFAGHVTGDDIVMNMDTGVRQRCEIWSEFSDLVMKAREKRRQDAEAQALQRSQTVEKRFGAARYVIAAVIILIVASGITLYFMFGVSEERVTNIEDTSAGDLVTASVDGIQTGTGVLPIEQAKRGAPGSRRSGGGGSGGGGGRGGMSAEDAMNQAANYGNLSGGMTQLSVGQIQSVMNRNVQRLASCMGGQAGRVSLDIVINGDGSVSGVSVTGMSGGVQSCISGRTRGIRFPAFGAPRMRASYYFEVRH